MSENLTIVQSIYSAFGKGDIPTILSHLADDVVWEEGGRDVGVPWLRPGRGKGHAANFFAQVGEGLDIREFSVKGFYEAGQRILVHCHLQATVRSTGKSLDDAWEFHVWTLGPTGKVVAFRHVLDTLLHYTALHP